MRSARGALSRRTCRVRRPQESSRRIAGARGLDRAALNANRTVHMNRRKLLGLAGIALAGTALLPAPGRAQTPKRGGTIVLRLWDPPHFDPYLQVSYKTHIVYSFTHSRLVKYKSGPGVVPGTL